MAQNQPNQVQWNGTQYDIQLQAADTGGALGVFASVCPAESGPPRHVHAAEDETFHILSGEVLFWMEGAERVAQAGDTVFVPRGQAHSFKVIGPRPARMLTIMTPGGFEGFFREMAEGQFRIPQDMAAIDTIAARYGLTFTGPPLGGLFPAIPAIKTKR